MKLTKREKQYTWKQWLEVAYLAIKNPIRFINYLSMRREIQSHASRTVDQQRADIQKYIKAIKAGDFEQHGNNFTINEPKCDE